MTPSTIRHRVGRFAGLLSLLGIGLLAGACASSIDPGHGSSPRPTAGVVVPVHVELAQMTASDIAIDVTDESGSLVSASSGTPGDGASVPPNTLLVTNDDPSTLRLTWVGGPCDGTDELGVDPSRTLFLLFQPPCLGDSLVSDRVLILKFSRPISAAGVIATLQDGRDALN